MSLDLNTCQQAFQILAARPDATLEQPIAGPRLYIRRKITGAGAISVGIGWLIAEELEL